MIKCIVPVSGGKDSQVCLKLAVEKFSADSVIGLFCDTQFEHPLTYAHVDKISKIYGVKIERINAGNVVDCCIKNGRFPSGTARHCTEQLKIIPSSRFYDSIADEFGHGFEVWYGMRGGESGDRAKRYAGVIDSELYAPNDILKRYPKRLEKKGVMFRLPIIDWSSSDVFAALNGTHNPLYDIGFDRVGCFPCLAAGDATKERAFGAGEFGRQQREKVRTIEIATGKNVFTSAGGLQRNNPNQIDIFDGCAICAI